MQLSAILGLKWCDINHDQPLIFSQSVSHSFELSLGKKKETQHLLAIRIDLILRVKISYCSAGGFYFSMMRFNSSFCIF